MGAQGGRTAFRVWPAYDHKSKTSVISAVAVDQSGGRLYLGLTDGQLEEHRIQAGTTAMRVALGARKHVGKKPVTAICHLEAAQKLAVLCEGSLHLLEQETLEGQPLAGLKGITCMAMDGAGGYPARLAVAVRMGKKSSRLMVYDVVAGVDMALPLGLSAMCTAQGEISEPLLIKALAWVGRNLILCTSLRYLLWEPATKELRELLALPEEAPSPTAVLPIPSAAAALLLVEQAGIVVDKHGSPTGTALTLPPGVPGLASSGLYVLAACADGVHIFDRTSSAWVQSLGYPGGLRAAPGQQLLVSQNVKGSCVLVAGYRKVWMYRPVALDEQAKELLRARNYAQAVHLADTCSGEGAPWADSAFAQAAFLLLHELRFTEAMAAFLRCSLTLFQPLELFPLFPEVTEPWVGLLPSKQYWGLHEPLVPLPSLVRNRLGDGSHATAMLHESQHAVAEYLLRVRKREGVEARDGIDTLLVALLSEVASAEALGPVPVPVPPGVPGPLATAAQQLRAFVEGPNDARVAGLAGPLRERGQLHVLALLLANEGNAAAALQIWREIAENPQGEAAESGEEGEPNPRVEAVTWAARVMAEERRVPAPLVLQYLPWLLARSPDAALRVLTGRTLPDQEVLRLLEGEAASEVRWRYLEHLVSGKGSRLPAHHTLLALGLADAALALMPPPDLGVAPWERARAAGGRSPGPGEDRLRDLRHRLCKVLEGSPYYDVDEVLRHIRTTDLWDEQFILHSKAGQTKEALRVVALVLGDMKRATAYCQALGEQEAYMTLLAMLLHPGEGRDPLYAEACQLLAAQGSQLDPRNVLDALSEDMPLGVAFDTIAHMLRERTHRQRQGRITRHLWRGNHLSTSASRAEVMSRRVLVGEQRACRLCHTRIGTKMCAVYPNGVVICFKCFRGADPHVCPLTGHNFLDPSASEAWTE
eukprot:jgi/Botrbrau1/13904/Bobra.0017s0011.1